MSTKRKSTRPLSLLLPVVVVTGAAMLSSEWSAAETSPPGESTRSIETAPLAKKAQRPRQSALASDLDPAAEVARELFQLQQELGGSVVTDRVELEGWSNPPAPVTSRSAPSSAAQPQLQSPPPWSDYPPQRRLGGALATTGLPNLAVTELREAAWQLVTTAHRLEQLDLYTQADALRTLAQRLRQDARGMKQADGAAQSESVSATKP